MDDEPMQEPGTPLAARVVPRRAAGKKASELAAAQLESSPQSERDVVFGEPAGSRGKVKVTYGSKGKKNSPRKETRPRSESPTPVRPSPAPRANLPRGRATARVAPRQHSASRSPASDDDLPVLTESEDEAVPSDRKMNGTRNKRKVTSVAVGPVPAPSSRKAEPSAPGIANKGKGRKVFQRNQGIPVQNANSASVSIPRLDTGSPSQRQVGASPQISVQPGSRSRARRRAVDIRKRARSISSEGSLSDLGSSPLSSIPSSATKPPLSRTVSQWSTMSSLFAESPTRAPVTTPRGQRSVLPRSLDVIRDTEAWSVETLGALVWVRLSENGDVVEDDSGDLDSVWWPAKVVSPKTPLRASLFGNSPAGSSNIKIGSPSSSNVLSMTCNGALRFNDANFRQVGPTVTPRASPKKKQRTDLDLRWSNARTLMLQADEDENDGLPAMLSSYVDAGLPASGKTNRSNGKPSAAAYVIPDSDEERPWRAPSPDPRYTIPGEPVLAKDKRGRSEFWPGKIMEYIRPAGHHEKAKYRVLFYDGMAKDLDITQFFTQDDDGFETCLLGKDAFDYGLNDDDASDWENDNEPDFNEEALRTVSPPPSLPRPHEFDTLSMDEQFSFVKPVLLSVIHGDYGPAIDRHDGFMRGGGARQKVRNAGYERGHLSQRDVITLERLIRRWVKKNDMREQAGIAVHHEPDSSEVTASSTRVGTVAAAEGEDKISRSRESSRSRKIAAEALTSLSAAVPGPAMPATADKPHFPGVGEVADARRRRSDGVQEHLKEAPTAPAAVSEGPVSQEGDEQSVVRSTGQLDQLAPAFIDGAARVDEGRARPSLTFKDLNALDKIAYCTDILLREAILQLVLWKEGHRDTPQLLAPEEEQRLHTLALELATSFAEAEDFSWVQDIIRLKLAVDTSAKKRAKVQSSGTRAANQGRAHSRRRNA